jgi:nitroreductase
VQSPSSFDIRHWCFIVLRDPELRRRMRSLAFDQLQLRDVFLTALITVDDLQPTIPMSDRLLGG